MFSNPNYSTTVLELENIGISKIIEHTTTSPNTLSSKNKFYFKYRNRNLSQTTTPNPKLVTQVKKVIFYGILKSSFRVFRF
jgi:hypothetical protein